MTFCDAVDNGPRSSRSKLKFGHAAATNSPMFSRFPECGFIAN
jgi:hypothetical protein